MGFEVMYKIIVITNYFFILYNIDKSLAVWTIN